MRIHFVAAISQSPRYGVYYERIVDELEGRGHDVFAKHILAADLKKVFDDTDEGRVKHYKSVLSSIGEADVLVAEASFPSTVNVGYEISLAIDKAKPVVVLYKQGRSPVFFEGVSSERLILESYTDSDLEKVLRGALEYAATQQDSRFNFFISPKIANYLDWVSINKKIPRAVYLRKLIENDMKSRGKDKI